MNGYCWIFKLNFIYKKKKKISWRTEFCPWVTVCWPLLKNQAKSFSVAGSAKWDEAGDLILLKLYLNPWPSLKMLITPWVSCKWSEAFWMVLHLSQAVWLLSLTLNLFYDKGQIETNAFRFWRVRLCALGSLERSLYDRNERIECIIFKVQWHLLFWQTTCPVSQLVSSLFLMWSRTNVTFQIRESEKIMPVPAVTFFGMTLGKSFSSSEPENRLVSLEMMKPVGAL